MYTLNIKFEDGDTSILSFDRENLLKLKERPHCKPQRRARVSDIHKTTHKLPWSIIVIYFQDSVLVIPIF